ncbi:hypothetical protein EYD10_02058 [Varanus komodoensis]|nr:hypothetical protein EYD10_02058 [Varanus komodoensis]
MICLFTGHFAKRKKTSLWFTVALLVVSVFILTIGLAATTRTENVTVGGYYPGIILGFGSFLGIIGIHLVENRKQMLIASIVFISFGVVAAFCCAIVDGVFAARHIVSDSQPGPENGGGEKEEEEETLLLSLSSRQVVTSVRKEEEEQQQPVRSHPPDRSLNVTMEALNRRTEVTHKWELHAEVVERLFQIWGTRLVDLFATPTNTEPRPLYNKRCQYYSSGEGFLYDAYQTEVTCYTLNNKCQLKVKSNTCYCCNLYNCENSEHSTSYYEFLGVSSCQDVVHLYRLLWSSTVLNIIGLFLGIVTAAILGAFKDVVPISQIAFSSAPPPQILYNPAQQLLTYAGFCPSAAAVPHYSSYHLPLQPTSNFPASSSTDISLSDDTQPPSQASSNYGLPPNAPPLYAPAYYLSGEKPPPYLP